MSYEMRIESKYWNNSDQNSLFDYDCGDYTDSSISVKSSGYIMQCDKEILYFNQLSRRNHPDYLITLFVHPHSNDFCLNIEKDLALINYESKMWMKYQLASDNWLVIRHSYSKNNLGLKLHVGDIIKLGKVVFQVKEVMVTIDSHKVCDFINGDEIQENVFNNEAILGSDISDGISHHSGLLNLNPETGINNSNDKIPKSCKDKMMLDNKNQQKYSFTCRICFGDNTEDVLISVCKCIGSVKYIHLKCFLKWIASKLQVKTYNYLSVYSYTQLQCEICKTSIPNVIKVKNKVISLLNPSVILRFLATQHDERFDNYLALECMKDKRGTDSHSDKNSVYIINFKGKEVIQIGRSTESHVRMTDISVSRSHSILRVHQGEIYIQDNSSKFGTYLNVSYNTILPALPQKPIALQCDKLFLKFYLRKTCLSFFCCKKNLSEVKAIEDYNYIFDQIRKKINENNSEEGDIRNADICENENSKDLDIEMSKEKVKLEEDAVNHNFTSEGEKENNENNNLQYREEDKRLHSAKDKNPVKLESNFKKLYIDKRIFNKIESTEDMKRHLHIRELKNINIHSNNSQTKEEITRSKYRSILSQLRENDNMLEIDTVENRNVSSLIGANESQKENQLLNPTIIGGVGTKMEKKKQNKSHVMCSNNYRILDNDIIHVVGRNSEKNVVDVKIEEKETGEVKETNTLSLHYYKVNNTAKCRKAKLIPNSLNDNESSIKDSGNN